MKFYFAPMEGITQYPLRNTHKEMFGDSIDKYFTPFLTASSTHHFKNREKKDALPENSSSFANYKEEIVPQIMAGNAENFIWAAHEMHKLGYSEVNLNLGCPAPTVVNRRKGAGLLQDPTYLDEMLKEIFTALSEDDIAISLKTRLGFTDVAEAEALMGIYASYPVKELTIHARVREDYYKNSARIEAFDRAVDIYREKGGKADICFNGNIFSKEGLERFSKESRVYSEVSAIMLGRGLLSDPALARQLKGGAPLDKEELKSYLKRLYEEYEKMISEDRNVIFKLLEHWAFLNSRFKDSDKYIKAIRKARSRGEYMAAVSNLFAKCDFM
ncbi:tRNA dihydrouridine synthase [Butyrivibrio proteoclasticus]|uniref:tRNA dihydrouridine synthase n=1 Tax=Butyrivibrio proteoclasticus TaxID=43305 RepID=UPI000479DD71|nr:tRNA-dihydrouridine synthase family protein [Butyrivibrio proteoclasticus]